MGLDEAGTAKALREHRAAIDLILAGHGGRVFKTTGDGVLVEFPSIVAAVECAVAVQKLMAERNADVPDAESSAERLLRNPITGIAGCCARAATGDAMAAPPSTAMNSRRLIRSPRRRAASAQPELYTRSPRQLWY